MIYYISYFYPDPQHGEQAWNIAMLNPKYEFEQNMFYGRINRNYVDDPTNHWFKDFGTSAKKGMIYYFEVTNHPHKLINFTLVG